MDADRLTRAFVRGLDELRKLDSEMQAQTIKVFLLIMQRPGISMREIEQFTGLASSTTSRNVAALGKIHRKGMPGHDLIIAREDPQDRRMKRCYPTAKGKLVFQQFQEAMVSPGL